MPVISITPIVDMQTASGRTSAHRASRAVIKAAVDFWTACAVAAAAVLAESVVAMAGGTVATNNRADGVRLVAVAVARLVEAEVAAAVLAESVVAMVGGTVATNNRADGVRLVAAAVAWRVEAELAAVDAAVADLVGVRARVPAVVAAVYSNAYVHIWPADRGWVGARLIVTVSPASSPTLDLITDT